MLDPTTLQYYYKTLVEEYERNVEQFRRVAMVRQASKHRPGLVATVPVQSGLRSGSHMAGAGLTPRSVYH